MRPDCLAQLVRDGNPCASSRQDFGDRKKVKAPWFSLSVSYLLDEIPSLVVMVYDVELAPARG